MPRPSAPRISEIITTAIRQATGRHGGKPVQRQWDDESDEGKQKDHVHGSDPALAYG